MRQISRWIKANGWRDLALPLLVYTLVALIITWPLGAHLSTHLAGPEYSDSIEYARLGWWARYALQHGLNPFQQSLFGYPQGFFSAVQWAQPLIYLPITILGFVMEPAAAFNVWLLLEVILSGLTAYWLCREVLIDHDSECVTPAALFGGLIFMAFPTVQGNLIGGHVNPLSNYALPVLVLCCYRLVEGTSGWRTVLVGSLSLLTLALGNFTFPAFVLLPLILFGGGYALVARRGQLRAALPKLAIMFSVGALLMIPFYIPLYNEITAPQRPAYLQEGGWIAYSTDPLAFIALSPFTPWTQPIVPAYSWSVLGTNVIEGAAYLGVVAVILAVIAVWRRRHAAWLWLVMALGCMLFSLGPILKWGNQPVVFALGDTHSNIVLPWALFQNLPLISATRTPGRFNIMTALALGVLAALGLESLLRSIRVRWRRLLLVGALACFSLIEYQLMAPFPITPIGVPAYFNALAGSDKRAVFDVPVDDPLAQKVALAEQIAHHKPLIAGYISRRTPVDPAKLTLLSNMATGNTFALDSSTLDKDATRSILRDSGADVVVYHWYTLDKARVLPWAVDQFGQPAYQDNWTAIFEIPAPAQPFDGIAATYSSSGWWRRNRTDIPWLVDDASIDLYTPQAADRHWIIAVSSLLQSRRVQLWIDGRLTQVWRAASPGQQIDFWLRLEPGFHSLRFILPDGCTPVPVVPACLLYDTSQRSEQACRLKDDERNLCVGMAFNSLQSKDAGDMAVHPMHVRLTGDSGEIALLGTRLPTTAQAGQQLTVVTDWQLVRKLPGDYHLFVHVLDSNGKLAAQYDRVPGNGAFPTTQWSAAQAWSGVATLDLPANLSPGMYKVYTGWYRYPDLTRLNVEGQPNGLVLVGSVQVR